MILPLALYSSVMPRPRGVVCFGRFLLPDCKRTSNHEGLGSSLTFHRATVAYALLFNLTIADEPYDTALKPHLSPTQKPGRQTHQCPAGSSWVTGLVQPPTPG